MYRYQKKQGEDHRIFSQDGVRNLSNGIVESDHELNSPYLELVQEAEVAPQAAQTPPAASVQAPNPLPQNQPVSVNQPPVAVPAPNEQTANMEASK